MADPATRNEETYESLLVSIEAGQGILNILIAVCDDGEVRDRIIDRYETELQPQIHPYRVELAKGEPSLKSAIDELVEGDEYLQQGGEAVITVTGAEKLYFLRLGEARSEQDIFFGYLQWTREALREVPYSIVLWVTQEILEKLERKAPDFWSWRKGVFRFERDREYRINIPRSDFERMLPTFSFDDRSVGSDVYLSIEDLRSTIASIEQSRSHKSSELIALYESLAKVYQQRVESGDYENLQEEQELAIAYFQKAIDLREKLDRVNGLGETLYNLGGVYELRGDFNQAKTAYSRALAIQEEKNFDPLQTAESADKLGRVYHNLGEYELAENFYQKGWRLRKEKLGDRDSQVATSLNNLVQVGGSRLTIPKCALSL